MEALMTVAEAAEVLKVARATVYMYVYKRVIPHIKCEGALRFSPSALQAWIDERSVAPRPR